MQLDSQSSRSYGGKCKQVAPDWTESTQSERAYMSIAVGMAIGIAVGAVLGVFALHDIMQGIAIGLPLGAGISATLFALGDDL